MIFSVAWLACSAPVPAPMDSGVTDSGVPDAGAPASTCGEVKSAPTDLAAYELLLACLRNPATTQHAQHVDDFVTAVERRGGFPISTGSELVFVYVRDARYDLDDDSSPDEDFALERRQLPLRVAGEFNAWSATQYELQQEPGEFFHRRLPLAAGTQRWHYKLIARGPSGDVWFSDPHSRRFEFDSFGRISLVRGGDQAGHLEWVRAVGSSGLRNTRHLSLYVPPGYDSATAKYPVIYMHDGQNLFDAHQPGAAFGTWDADGVAEAEIAAGRVRKLIIVGIPNTADRMDEYTPVQDTVGGQAVGGKGDLYADFVVNEVKPLVDARYRTLADRDNTAVLGSSLGGVISFHLGLRSPSVFRYVGGMSSTFDWGSGLGNATMIDRYAMTADLAMRGQVFYLDSGGGPPASGPCPNDGPNDGRDNYCETLQMKAALEAKGITTYPLDPNALRLEPADIDIYHWWEPGAPHAESAWNARLFRPLRLFFRP